MRFELNEKIGLMPYQMEIPTNCLRRVSYNTHGEAAFSPVPATQNNHRQAQEEDNYSRSSSSPFNMMLYSNRLRTGDPSTATTTTTAPLFSPATGSHRTRHRYLPLMNMPGGSVWPNSPPEDNGESLPSERAEMNRWNYQLPQYRTTRASAAAAATAPFPSPLTSQNQRQSFASSSRHQTVAYSPPRRRIDDKTVDSAMKRDPLPPAAEWNASYDEQDQLATHLAATFEEDSKMPPPPPEGHFPFLEMGHPGAEFLEDDYQPSLDTNNLLPAAPMPPLGEAQYEIAAQPAVQMRVHAPRPSRHTRRNTIRNTTRFPHRQPSRSEVEACSTKRAKEALYVWYKRYNELVEYREKHSDCNVPQKYPDNLALGIWVNKMRMEKKHFDEDGKRSTALTQEKIDALEDIDFVWARQKGDKLWHDKFRDLQAYAQENGHCNVPTKYREDTALGRWVSTQRKQYKEMKMGKRTLMTEERAERLEALGFRWNAMETRHDDAESS